MPAIFPLPTCTVAANVNLTQGLVTHGIPESPFISLGLAAPGIRDHPLHPAAAGHVLDLHHPLSRAARRARIHLCRGASRHGTAPAVLQSVSASQAY